MYQHIPGLPQKSYIPLHITLSSVCRSIPDCAYQDTDNLEWISIPESVRHIGDWAFFACGNLQTVLLEPGILTIGESAFSRTHLRDIILPDTLYYLGDGCFEDTMLETITVPGGIPNIYANTFCDNFYLRSVCLKEGIQHIHNGAFAWCRSLREIFIPDSLESIDPYAFEDSTPILSIHASEHWRREHPQYIKMLIREDS